MTWKVIVRSAIGTSHQNQELPCQDFGDYSVLEHVLAGAVADGAGSAKYSDLGAKLAVKVALAYLTRIGTYFYKRSQIWQKLEQVPDRELITKLFTRTAKKAIAALQVFAASQNYESRELACTLLVFVATPQWLAAMQIGDGFIVVRSGQEPYTLLFQPDKGEYINETTFLTSDQALAEMQICVHSQSPEFICVSTDGLEKVAIKLSDWTPFPPFFAPLEQFLSENHSPDLKDDYLIDFLNSDRLNARTDDDKTLLLSVLS